MRSRGPIAVLEAEQTRAFWRAIRTVTMFAVDGPSADASLWRISTAPAQGAELGRRLAAAGGVELAYDWAGGLVWATIASCADAGSARVRDALAQCGGHAMLVRAPAAARALVPVFEPQEQPLAALTARVKASFDPQGVLNPGRMWAGV